MFKKCFEERFVPYLGSRFIVVDNANLQVDLLDKTLSTNTRKLVQLKEHSCYIQPHKRSRSCCS